MHCKPLYKIYNSYIVYQYIMLIQCNYLVVHPYNVSLQVGDTIIGNTDTTNDIGELLLVFNRALNAINNG